MAKSKPKAPADLPYVAPKPAQDAPDPPVTSGTLDGLKARQDAAQADAEPSVDPREAQERAKAKLVAQLSLAATADEVKEISAALVALDRVVVAREDRELRPDFSALSTAELLELRRLQRLVKWKRA